MSIKHKYVYMMNKYINAYCMYTIKGLLQANIVKTN